MSDIEEVLPDPATPDRPFGMLATTAQVRMPSLPTDKLLEMVQTKAPDPSVFDTNPPYFWAAIISQSVVDAYGTKMMPSTLQNYAQDAADGVSFQNSHQNYMLGLGRSIDGRYVGPNGPGAARTEASFYTIPGLAAGGGMSTDEFITRVRAGIAFDVSVGFYGGEVRCSICNLRMLTYWSDPNRCPHIPGMEYDSGKKTPEGAAIRVRAIGLIENARLAEVSVVYDGACPGAGIIKAQQEAAAGRLTPQDARWLEAQYGSRGIDLRLTEARSLWPGFTIEVPADTKAADETKGVSQTMPDKNEAQPTQPSDDLLAASASLRSIRDKLRDAGMPVTTGPEAAVDHLLTELRDKRAEVDKLTPLAAFGEQARAALIEDTIRELVRVNGNDWKGKDAMRRSLERTETLDDLRVLYDDAKGKADDAFKGGAKVKPTAGTSPAEAQAERKRAQDVIPIRAYASRGR